MRLLHLAGSQQAPQERCGFLRAVEHIARLMYGPLDFLTLSGISAVLAELVAVTSSIR